MIVCILCTIFFVQRWGCCRTTLCERTYILFIHTLLLAHSRRDNMVENMCLVSTLLQQASIVAPMAAWKTNKQLGRVIESVSAWERESEFMCIRFEGHEKDGWWRKSRGLRVIKWYCVDADRALRWKGRISWTGTRSEDSTKTGTNTTHSHSIYTTRLSTAIKLMNWVWNEQIKYLSAGSIKSRLIWSLILFSLAQCSHGMCAKRRPSLFRRIGSYFSLHH